MIKIFSSGRYKLNRQYILAEAENFAARNGVSHNSLVNVVFVGKRKMIEIAQKYKKENEALPVLSFAYKIDSRLRGNDILEEEEPLGEVFICYPQAVLLAAEKERPVDKMMVELVRHGIENILNN